MNPPSTTTWPPASNGCAIYEVLSGGAAVVRIATPDVDVAMASLTSLGLPNIEGDAVRQSVQATIGAVAAETVAAALVAAGVRLRGLAVERPALEDLFVSLTGEGFDVLR